MSKIFASENPLIKDYFSVQINSFRSEQTTYIIDSESSSVKTSCYTKVQRNNNFSKKSTIACSKDNENNTETFRGIKVFTLSSKA